jgi:hypothetical protein
MSQSLGISFSAPQLEYLELPVRESLQTALQFGFSHLRLGAYWSRIEKKPDEYDFTELIDLVTQCQQANQPVVITLGVKAPRWPEFYWPDFIEAKTPYSPVTQQQILRFITKTVHALQSFNCITHWQVENEPLDPSGPNQQTVPLAFLTEEVELVRSLDHRPVMITLWGNQLLQRGFFDQAVGLADVVGIDLYNTQFVAEIMGKSLYKGPSQSSHQLRQLLASCNKPIWIAELQAEPWEKNEVGFKSATPKSMNIDQLKKNIDDAKALPIAETLLWGFEYWLWRDKNGDTTYLDFVQSVTEAAS